jgi:hypothetical protein
MATRTAPEPRDNDSIDVFISLRGSYYEIKLTHYWIFLRAVQKRIGELCLTYVY